MKKIFFCIYDADRKALVDRICAEEDIAAERLKGSDADRTVASICKLPLKDKGSHKTAPPMYMLPEMLLFYGMDEEALDRFLEAYRAGGLEKIKRKAVITPTNLGWTLYELAEQLGIESREA